MPINIMSCIVCDDIRRENTGKDIIIGVYNGDIVVGAYPVTIPLSFWIEFMPEAVGQKVIDFRIEHPSGNPPVQGKINVSVRNVRPTVINLIRVPISIERDGDLIVSLREGDGDWAPIRMKNVSRIKQRAD